MGMEKVRASVNGHDRVTSTFWSMSEFADACELARNMGQARHRSYDRYNLDDALVSARNGWNEQLGETLKIAEDAVTLAERNHEIMRVTTPVYDVAGGSVDIGRYLAGDPECMVSWPLQPVSNAGKVISLCVPVTYSGSVSDETVIRRGQVIVALAIALSRLGHNIELWADRTNTSKGGAKQTRIRVLVKAATDPLDASKVMFAYAHPNMLRSLCWTYDRVWPSAHESAIGNCPTESDHDLPDGAIYLKPLVSDHDVPDAHTQLRAYLDQLGLLAE